MKDSGFIENADRLMLLSFRIYTAIFLTEASKFENISFLIVAFPLINLKLQFRFHFVFPVITYFFNRYLLA